MGDNKRIAKNAIALYLRTLFTIFISLFTSRVLLLKLGEEDFGIFSVVGGVAILFSFLSNSLATATQRYLTLSLSDGNIQRYKQVFTTSLNCYLAICIVIFLFAETIGLYLVNHVLNIPQERMVAANCAYQFAMLSFLIGMTNGPYRASIIAHEKFTYFAWTDIWVKICKLAIVYIMAVSPWDKLIVYSALFMSVSLLQIISDKIYCHYKFNGCRYIIKYWDLTLFKSIITFSGLSLVRAMADIGVNQGNNIIINQFGGTIASASFGLANQVWGTTTGFFINVQAAFNPQITKSWGEHNNSRFNSLIILSSKFSSYMVMFIALPLVINMPFVLGVWLRSAPMYATDFCTITIFSCYVSAVTGPVKTAILAVGEIKRYMIVSSLILIICVPASYIALKMGCSLIVVYVMRVCFQMIELFYCARYLKGRADFDFKKYILTLFINIAILGSCLGFSYFAKWIVGSRGGWSVIASTAAGWILLLILVWRVGMDSNQRQLVLKQIKKYAINIR